MSQQDLPPAAPADAVGRPTAERAPDPGPLARRDPAVAGTAAEASGQFPVTRFARPAHDLRPDRRHEDVERMADSVRQHGVLTPLLVFERADGKLEIIAGFTRYLAALREGLEALPARVIPEPPPADKLALALIENDRRTELTVLQRAEAYARYLRLKGCTQAEVAAVFSVAPSDVSKALSISKGLCEEGKEAVLDGALGPTAAAAISRLPDPGQQRELVARCLSGALKRDAVEAAVAKLLGGRPKKARPVAVRRGGASAAFPGDWPAERVVEWLTAALDGARRLVKLELPTSHLNALLRS